MTNQTADIAWRDGVPIATAFDDPYYSLENGLAETEYVFLGGNDLPARFAGDFQIAELGFGTGLNFLVTWAAWEAAGKPCTLAFTSFEAFPMAAPDMGAALAHFPSLAQKAEALVAASGQYSQGVALDEGLVLTVIAGDARQTVPAWNAFADAWFLDGFAPAKNPALWEPALLQAVAQHTRPNGTAATYTAAGHVRRGLQEAGFLVNRVKGFGRKRHMTTARKPDAE